MTYFRLLDELNKDELVKQESRNTEYQYSFGDEKYKVMITLAPELMEEGKKAIFEEKLKEYNEKQHHPIIHINTTFEAMANAISDVLDDRDYEMQDVLADYLNYCYTDGLIPVSDAWKYMRMQLAGTTLDFNVSAKETLNKSIHCKCKLV